MYGIDGFRFDLARILANDSDNAATWVADARDFAPAHLHAEPWDLGGAWFDFMDNYGYNANNNRWAKWVGRFRDDLRNFSKSTLANRSAFKRHLEGYGSNGGTGPASSRPWRSVNILAVHDGYTLRDTVFYNDNGGSHNCWDSGGDENLRRGAREAFAGRAAHLPGRALDSPGRRVRPNPVRRALTGRCPQHLQLRVDLGRTPINNVSWIDWRLKDGDNRESPTGPTYGKELSGWTRDLIALRKRWSHFRRANFPAYASDAAKGGKDAGAVNDGRFTYIWEGPPDGSPSQIAVIWWGKPGEPDLLVAYNEAPTPFTVMNLADWSGGNWKVLARSSADDAHDFADLDRWEASAEAAGPSIEVKGRSMAVLISDND